jgi:hypothetical protein
LVKFQTVEDKIKKEPKKETKKEVSKEQCPHCLHEYNKYYIDKHKDSCPLNPNYLDSKKNNRINGLKHQFEQEIKILKQQIQDITQNKSTINDSDYKIAWEALSRVIRQLSSGGGKKRSPDWKRGAIPVRDKLEKYLKNKGIIK